MCFFDFFVVWALILLLCLRHCRRNAYAASGSLRGSYTFEGVPTQGQRPCKTMPQPTCLLRLHTPGSFWKSGQERLLTRPESHQHFAKWHALRHPAGAPASRLQTAPCSLQQHKHPDSKTPIDILQPHQHPGPKAHTKHLANRSLKAHDHAGVKPSKVFGIQRAKGRFCAVQRVEYGLVRAWDGGQSAHPSLRGAYAKSMRSLHLFQGSPGRNPVNHSAQARALWPL